MLQAKDHCRAFHHISKSPVSSDWIQDGKYLTFAEYRFAIRARLNILPTKTVARRAGKSQLDTKCRKCKLQPETLGHILNACTPNTFLMTERHNKILERLIKAIPYDLGDKFKEQKPLGFPGDLRLDLVVHNRKSGEVTIIDVTIPFESDKDASDKARKEKAQKYSPLVTWYQEQEHNKNLYYETFVVGALGSWDPLNKTTLSRLKIGNSYAKLFKKLCVIDSIKGSYRIWNSSR